MVPVIQNADQLPIPQLARALADVAERARTNKITVDEMRGGTFTISNLGAIGGTYSTPVINPPEAAILLVGRAREMPVVVEGEIKPRLMMPLSLTYDHRLVDGAAAARFLRDLIGFLEAPGRLLLAP
jgi:pyruvate/2-oxoglutarate dehydrogenase complex dihydrolipoamide acyltransferase (E2) component